MDKQQTIKKMVEVLSSASQESAKYFQEEVKKAFKNGEKYLSRRDGKLKTILEFQAEALIDAGIGDTKQAVREFADYIEGELTSMWQASFKTQNRSESSTPYTNGICDCLNKFRNLVKEMCEE